MNRADIRLLEQIARRFDVTMYVYWDKKGSSPNYYVHIPFGDGVTAAYTFDDAVKLLVIARARVLELRGN